jgi:hypothetical protein
MDEGGRAKGFVPRTELRLRDHSPESAELFDPSTSLSGGRFAPFVTEIRAFCGVFTKLRPQYIVARRKGQMDPHERPVVTEDNKVAVRGGSTGNNVRYVLIASTALVICAFIAIALFVRT